MRHTVSHGAQNGDCCSKGRLELMICKRQTR